MVKHIDYSGYGVFPMAIDAATYVLWFFCISWIKNNGKLEDPGMERFSMMWMVAGSIPPCAGLSSSSSIVCASALATLAIYTHETFSVISRAEFAELCAHAEHYIGTEGGGMDQAIEVLATKGHAMLIEFNPLRWTAVRLPETAFFAVLHCGKTLHKAATSHYNERVVECRIAAQKVYFIVLNFAVLMGIIFCVLCYIIRLLGAVSASISGCGKYTPLRY
uniref:GHMP kinase N-terminal domain-containing protein n=1 Tax=Parascaris equorum TaxID=6256 RepID=A0A914RPC2_PAREQ